MRLWEERSFSPRQRSQGSSTSEMRSLCLICIFSGTTAAFSFNCWLLLASVCGPVCSASPPVTSFVLSFSWWWSSSRLHPLHLQTIQICSSISLSVGGRLLWCCWTFFIHRNHGIHRTQLFHLNHSHRLFSPEVSTLLLRRQQELFRHRTLPLMLTLSNTIGVSVTAPLSASSNVIGISCSAGGFTSV